jgi:hypothetical protein
MRFIFILCALCSSACDTSSSTPEDFAVPGDLSVPDMTNMFTCSNTCTPACASGTTCVSQGGGVTPFNATCLASCTSSADCAGGRQCVDIYGAQPSGRYCVNTMEPQECGTHCDLTPPVSLCSGSELGTTYQGVVCGIKYAHCANGCVEDAPDGGQNRNARCL